MRNAIRAIKLLALTVWVGGLVFFAFVLAPTVFSPAVVDRTHGFVVSGVIVGMALGQLHWIGLISGMVFTVCALALRGRLVKWEGITVACMLLLTAFSQFSIIPRMQADQRQVGDIDSVSIDHPARVDFERLHNLSERVEGLVLLGGIGLIILAAKVESE